MIENELTRVREHTRLIFLRVYFCKSEPLGSRGDREGGGRPVISLSFSSYDDAALLPSYFTPFHHFIN